MIYVSITTIPKRIKNIKKSIDSLIVFCKFILTKVLQKARNSWNTNYVTKKYKKIFKDYPKILAKKPFLSPLLLTPCGIASVSQPLCIILDAPKHELKMS